MKKPAALILIIALAGCTTATELRRKPVAFERTSTRSVTEVAACATRVLKGFGTGLVTTDAIPGGVSIALNGRVQFGMTVWMIIDVTGTGGVTTLSAKGIGRQSKNPEKDYAGFIACLK